MCALIIAGMSLALAACNVEHRVKIKDCEVILEDAGLKVKLPKGWVVFDTQDAWNKGRTVLWGTQYTLVTETNDVSLWEPRFLMSAEKPGGGIAMVLGIGSIPENMDAESLARKINDSVMMAFNQGSSSVCGTVEQLPESDYTKIPSFISTVQVTLPNGESDILFTITDYIFACKDRMYCMEIYVDESAGEDGKNIQISPAEL